jgi:hypothetical protein
MMKSPIHLNINNLLIAIALGVLSNFISCDILDGKLEVINNTQDTIYYTYSNNDTISHSPIILEKGKVSLRLSRILLPSKSCHLHTMDTWEEIIESSPSKSLYIYFYDSRIIRMPKDTFLIHNPYIKRVKLTLEELKALNWKVKFNN